MSSTEVRADEGLSVDLGSGFSGAGICDGRNSRVIDCSLQGPQFPTVAFEDPKSGKWYFGQDALLHSYKDTGDNLFMHVKRNLPERAREKIYGGRYTPIDILAKLLTYIRQLLLSVRPDFADHPCFGGSKFPPEKLALVFTIPANWGLETRTAYEEPIRSAGFDHFGFVREPIAAVRRIGHLSKLQLQDGDMIAGIDVGAGTSDIGVVKHRRGVYDQVAAASGDAYLAGHDFTNAVAEHLARHFRISWDGVYDPKGGFNLSQVPARRRAQVVACWLAAEDAKKKISVLEEVTVAVEFPKGRKTFSITRKKAKELWQPLYARFRECLAKALDGTELAFDDINHVMLFGGGSRVTGLREETAAAVGRDVSEILVCTDAEHTVATGGAEHAYFQDAASQALESGLGFIVRDPVAGTHRNVLMVPPGKILPPDGLFMERAGFQIDTRGGRKMLRCRPFVCRAGVRAAVAPGRETILEDSEIVPLVEVEHPLDEFPEGDHPVLLGVRATTLVRIRLLVRPTMLTHLETLSIPLRMEHGNGSANGATTVPLEILLILDCSGSMKGEKLAMLQRGAKKFAKLAVGRGAQLGLIVLPGDPYASHSDDATLLCPATGDLQPLNASIDGLQAGGGTPLHAGLHLARDNFPRTEGDAQRIAVMFTDGMPNKPHEAVAAAEPLRRFARLITVGIGEDVDAVWLKSLASAPTDYRYAECPEDILDAFDDVTELLWSNGQSQSDGPADVDEHGAEPDVDDDEDYQNDWNDTEDE